MTITLVILAWLIVGGLTILLLRRMTLAQRSRRRAFQNIAPDAPVVTTAAGERGWLGRRLFLAGYRKPGAAGVFLLATLLCGALGLLLAWTFAISGPGRFLIDSVSQVPGGVGEVFIPIAYLTPWFLFLLLAALPALAVRQARRTRVLEVEQDLPTSLELMAALSEAGLGLDSAIARIRETSLGHRPLASELRSYQADMLSGRPRVECLRRLARRLEVSSVTVFVSALVQAEQLGMGIADVLRRQADDHRDRRRERANAFAMALPVKRIFPLVICFLPGLFVWALGPFFVQLFKLADTFGRVRGF
jgi:tight adherence protein C